MLTRHNEALLGAALCDERPFELLMEHVRVPTSQGDLPASALPARGAVHVILDNGGGFEEMLFRAMGVPVAHGHRYAVVPFRGAGPSQGPAPGRAGYRGQPRTVPQ